MIRIKSFTTNFRHRQTLIAIRDNDIQIGYIAEPHYAIFLFTVNLLKIKAFYLFACFVGCFHCLRRTIRQRNNKVSLLIIRNAFNTYAVFTRFALFAFDGSKPFLIRKRGNAFRLRINNVLRVNLLHFGFFSRYAAVLGRIFQFSIIFTPRKTSHRRTNTRHGQQCQQKVSNFLHNCLYNDHKILLEYNSILS